MTASTGVVRVDHHQFYLAGLDVDPTEASASGTLLEVGDGFVSFFTGIAYGPVEYTIAVSDDRPPVEEDGWEVIEESAVESSTPLHIIDVDGTISDGAAGLPAGRYRIRAHARGRDTRSGEDVAEPSERYLIQLWPTATLAPHVDLILKTDRAWSPTTQVNESNISTEYVFVRGEDGEVKKVAPQGPEAQAVRAVLSEYGGKPLTPALEAIFATRMIAGLDRPLLDRLEAASPEQQLQFVRWCIRTSWERAGFAHIDWFAQVLSDMDAGLPRHPDFVNSSAARNRLDEDPRITRVIGTGLPAMREVVPQYQALMGYTRSLYDGISALEAAIEALLYAAMTYGMDYPELLEDAHTALSRGDQP